MAATEGAGHLLRYVNAAFCAMSDTTSDVLLGYPILDVLPRSVAGTVFGMLETVRIGGESQTVICSTPAGRNSPEVRMSYTAWAIPETENTASGIGLVINSLNANNFADPEDDLQGNVMSDLNSRLLIASLEQHELADVAARAEKRLTDLVDGLDAIVCEVDAITARVSFVNNRAESFLGYSINEWTRPDFWRRLIHPDDYEKAMENLEAAKDESGHCKFDYRVTTSAGSIIWLRNVVRALPDNAGQIIKLRCVIIDVTEQRNSLETLSSALQREQHIADTLQFVVLGEEPEKIYPGLTVATIYQPAMEEAVVGGDFFDTFSLPGGDVMLVVGDVTGKGLKAAARTVEVKYALRAFAQDYVEPGDNAMHLNNYICRQHPYVTGEASELVALLIVVIDPLDGRFESISAGAEPAFIVRASGEMVEMQTGGLMLGIEPSYTYDQMGDKLNDGDVLVLTSDGLTEVHRESDFFGCEGIARAIRDAAPFAPLSEIAQSILSAARAHSGGHFKDDVCLLLARRS
jgi:PAS domain S-box-containing protein